jgi:thymidylate synthase (FAD)
MSLPEELQRFTQPTKVLDDGHIMLVDVLGNQQSIIDAARVSYGAGTKRVSEDRNLLRYLIRNAHTSPLEMCEMVIRVRVPMDCWRQWIRHRTASVNEYSTRYSEAIDSSQTTSPDKWRAQSTDNKQGSSGFITDWPPKEKWDMEDLEDFTESGGTPGSYLSTREFTLHAFAREVYEERLAFGVAREVARKDLPLSTYTEAYWKCDLHNLLHFLELRLDPHAQQEIREYAEAIAEIVKVWVPDVWEAFEDYKLNGLALSAMETRALGSILQGMSFTKDQLKDLLGPKISKKKMLHMLKLSNG